MKSSSKTGTDALKKIFGEKKLNVATLANGRIVMVHTDVPRSVKVIEDDIDLTTRHFDKVTEYQHRTCYLWSAISGLKKLHVELKSGTIVTSGGSAFGTSRCTEREVDIKGTIAGALFYEENSIIGYPELVYKYISHIVLEYQVSLNEFKVFIHPLSPFELEGIVKGSLKQNISHDGKVETILTTEE